jgi:hypothetical protein
MRIRHSARAAVALAAAYAVALQTILLVFGGPVAGAANFATQPICSHFGDSSSAPPAGPGHDCLTACLTGCCCGAVAVPPPGVGGIFAPIPVQRVGAAVAAAPTVQLSATGAHRSRAPPPA